MSWTVCGLDDTSCRGRRGVSIEWSIYRGRVSIARVGTVDAQLGLYRRNFGADRSIVSSST